MPQRPTRDDVAHLAGVSTAVVSYVVNDGPRPVAAATRQRVLDAIQELSYRPNAAARAMKVGRSDTYGLLVEDFVNTFYAQLVTSIENRAYRAGKSIILALMDSGPWKEGRLEASLLGRDVEGLIAFQSNKMGQSLVARMGEIPTVLIDARGPVEGVETVTPDYHSGGRMATEHLISHGCKTIVTAHGPSDAGTKSRRLGGYLAAMKDAGLPVSPSVETSWDRAGGYRAGRIILDSFDTLPDGVFSFADTMSVGMLLAFHEAGVRIPEDLKMVSFDSTLAAQYSWPPLTSVRQPIDEIADHAVGWLSAPVPPPVGHTVLPLELDVRASCGC